MPSLTGPVIEPEGHAPTSAVVLLHGYGADGDDLIALGQAWRGHLPQTVFLAPNAPERLPHPHMPGLQWFNLTMRDPSEYWRGVSQAGPLLDAYLDEMLAHYDLPPQRLALVGFSQGTMMALHVGLRRSDSPAAIVGYSGMIAGPEHLSTNLTVEPPVQLIHGVEDDVIPADALHITREALAAAGLSVEWHLLPGLGHGIDNTGLGLAGHFLAAHLQDGRR